MGFILKTVLPSILFIGFFAYIIKVYYHFQYLKIVKKYPSDLTFFRFNSYINEYFFDRFELIMPILIKRKKENLSEIEYNNAIKLEKRIIILILITIIGFSSIPLGIYLQILNT